MRGTLASQDGRPVFTARTIWPADFAFNTAKLKSEPLKDASDLTDFVREPVNQQGGTDTRLLWERHPGAARAWQDKPVLGIVLSGAQGDDDESLGGHFAVATGRLGSQGDWSRADGAADIAGRLRLCGGEGQQPGGWAQDLRLPERGADPAPARGRIRRHRPGPLQIVGADGAAPRALSAYEQQLKNDVGAILLVRIPQIPSSRAMGSAPVFSFDEFRARVPENQADWKIVPVGARPFPAALQGEGFRAEPDPSAVPLPIARISGGLILAALARRRRKRSAAATAAPVAATAQ